MRRERGGITAKLIGLLCLVVVLTAIYLVRHPLLRFAGEELVVEDPLEKSDAIIVLSADNFYADRATRSAEFYRQGLAPVVVASGKRLRPRAGIVELMEHDLIERGVPKEKIHSIRARCGQHARRSGIPRETCCRKKLEEHYRCDIELSHAARALHFSKSFSRKYLCESRRGSRRRF